MKDGYPQLNLNISSATDIDGEESLAYLFDPTIEHEGKKSYSDVQGLLQVDDEGYYYYNSQENYAVYYEENNSFTLYEYPGVVPSGTSPVGQFFPFNEATADAETVPHKGKNYTLMSATPSANVSINHYFGLHMSTQFIQQNGGHVDDARSTPVTYEFSGDDDVWIFIDGVLVADLGGIHDAASVKIDFSTGKITINGTVHDQTLGKILGLNTDTLPDNTYHTLDFFYLERGNYDSNMYLKYNLVTIPESDLIKVDQQGDPVEGAEFTLYAANDYQNSGENATPIATGTTDSSGEFVFLETDAAGNSLPITIDTLYKRYHESEDDQGNNLILVESETPEGYRPAGYRSVEEIGLYFYRSPKDSNEILLLSNNIWDKGAYAMPKVTTTTSNAIQLLKDPNDVTGTQTGDTVPLVGAQAEDNPLMFAVVFQKQKDGQWHPVSGDPLTGWTVQEGSAWSNVLAAAQDSPYIFQIASSGAYQVEINNLPGDIRTYYHICKDLDQAKYTIAYYYTTADSLAGATEQNTSRINSETSNDIHDLSRVFSVDLYVTNIKNRLLVQKVDEDGAPVNGAVFSLYREDQVDVAADGTVTPKAGAVAYDSLTTGKITGELELDGGGVFPAEQEILPNGEYYLIETSAPPGYKLNDTAIHVVVDNSGVYANAGVANDGVTVLRGVGSIVRSMLQFAADDDVDTTLNAIQASMSTGVTFKGYNKYGSFTVEDANWSTGEIRHFQYANANKMLDYGLQDSTAAGTITIDDLTFATDTGWSKLLIRQCFRHDDTVDTSLKTDLKDMDITDLFSGTVTVRVSNDKTGNLKIGKTVTGEGAPSSQSFTFQVTVTDGETPISGTYDTVDQSGSRGKVKFENGIATVTLKNGESLTILALPTGAKYTVEEIEVPQRYTPSVTASNDDTATVNEATVTGTIRHDTSEDQAVSLSYTNVFNGDTSLALTGTKTLLGRDLAESDTFTFELTTVDPATTAAIENGKIVMPKETTTTVNGNGTLNTADFSFDEITFKEAGTYTFNIKETLPQDVNSNNPVSGDIWYDTHVTTVTVTVTRDSTTGILQAVPSYNNTGALSDSTTTDEAVFTNLWAGLTVRKTVSGNMGDRDKEFEFQITLTDADGKALTGSYRYAIGTTTGTLTLDQNGGDTFQLKHGQSISIYGLPEGSTYEISEPGAKADGYTVRVTVGSSTQTADETQGTLSDQTTTVAFENHKNQAPVTGIFLDRWPWLLTVGVVLAAGTALFFSARRTGKQRRAKGGKHLGG